MATSQPPDLSKYGPNIKATKMDHEKVSEAVALRGHASDDVPYLQLPTPLTLDVSEPFTSPIHVISMNGSGPGDGQGTALGIRKLIADVVLSKEPDILLFQEFKWQGIRGRAWKDTPLPDHYAYTGNTEASIMYDTRQFQLTELSQRKLQAPLEELKRTGKVSNDFTPIARSCIRILETKGRDKFKVLIVSWHGVHHRMIDNEKKKQFQDLQVYLKQLSEREDAAVLLGGDFNIKMSLIIDLVLPEFILYQYTPSKRREGKNIDYFIASPGLTLTDVGYIDLRKIKRSKDDKKDDTKTRDPYRLLDHDPISTLVTRRKTPEKEVQIPKNIALRELEASERAS